jgi:hypothetical protein
LKLSDPIGSRADVFGKENYAERSHATEEIGILAAELRTLKTDNKTVTQVA